jgi:hypothetical protein
MGRPITKEEQEDPLLALYGTGRELWADEHADEYIAHLRANWDVTDDSGKDRLPNDSEKT